MGSRFDREREGSTSSKGVLDGERMYWHLVGWHVL
jgi:hypothetical protein